MKARSIGRYLADHDIILELWRPALGGKVAPIKSGPSRPKLHCKSLDSLQGAFWFWNKSVEMFISHMSTTFAFLPNTDKYFGEHLDNKVLHEGIKWNEERRRYKSRYIIRYPFIFGRGFLPTKIEPDNAIGTGAQATF